VNRHQELIEAKDTPKNPNHWSLRLLLGAGIAEIQTMIDPEAQQLIFLLQRQHIAEFSHHLSEHHTINTEPRQLEIKINTQKKRPAVRKNYLPKEYPLIKRIARIMPKMDSPTRNIC
jgi:hypothetical protein